MTGNEDFSDYYFHVDLAALICREFVVELYIVQRQVVYLLLSFTTQYRTYWNQQTQDYIVHDVMPLDEHVGIVRIDSQRTEFFFISSISSRAAA